MTRTTQRSTRIKRGVFIVCFSTLVLAVTMLSQKIPAFSNASTSAFCLLIIVLCSAFFGDGIIAIITAITSTMCFDFFCLPPVGTFAITALPDILSLAAFMLTALVIGRLTASAAQHAAEVKRSEGAFKHMKEFESNLMLIPAENVSLSVIAQEALKAFSLDYCSIHAYGEGKWFHSTGAAMRNVLIEIEKSGLTLFKDHPTDPLELAEENMLGVLYARINKGDIPHVLIAVKSSSLPSSALGAIAGIVGLRIL